MIVAVTPVPVCGHSVHAEAVVSLYCTSWSVTARPLGVGAVQLTPSWRAVAVDSVGAAGAGGRPGLSLAEGPHAPSPRAFPARTCTSYSVPLVRLPIVAVVAVLGVVSGSSVQAGTGSVFSR